jgi:hypothetical protein
MFLLVSTDDNKIIGINRGMIMPAIISGAKMQNYTWCDWNEDIGTEAEPVYQGKAVPTDDGEWYYKDGRIVDKDGNKYVG